MGQGEVPALSVRQPWAWAIVAGIKTVENRSWATRYRGRLLIHSSGRFDREGVETLRRMRGFVLPDEFELGALIGEVRLVDVVTNARSRWAIDGQYHWLLDRPRQKRVAVRCVGQLGLFVPNPGGKPRYYHR